MTVISRLGSWLAQHAPRLMLRGLVAVTAMSVAAGTGFVALAWAAPFRPGDALFGLQAAAEQVRVVFTLDPAARANLLLDLAERRAQDLAASAGTEHELTALSALDAALNQAARAVAAAPPEASVALRGRLVRAAASASAALAQLVRLPADQPGLYAAAQAKVAALRAASDNADAETDAIVEVAQVDLGFATPTPAPTEARPTEVPLDQTQPVPFPPGANPHAQLAFQLTGQHAAIACLDCHTGGHYRGTPAECAACHTDVLPVPHYAGDCATCHSTTVWTPATFDHAGQTDCAACHTVDKPVNHFAGQCSTCHSTTAWTPATFSHVGQTDCAACHTVDKPVNHFAGQCSTCHSTSTWTPATFSHTGLADCVACHTVDKPANHFAGQCSACHATNAWVPANFSHAGLTDCVACHTVDKPANHFAGQCSACHATNAWVPATFSHAGLTDCAACHTKDKPANHFAGQCSNCHNTTSYIPATFNHSGFTDCAACHSGSKPANHFAGQCSACHGTAAWTPATFNHTGFTDCQACHGRPANHFTGQCSACHSTSAWTPASFNHTGFTDCQGCHARPQNHFGGQCSDCHNTSTWSGATFSHANIGTTDCSTCHAPPGNHFSGACRNCHTDTGNWHNATFDHAGLTDCQACHARPQNHFAGQCSDCHNTNSWEGATFSHSFPLDHGDANGNCASCHPSGGSDWTCYGCHDENRMINKHNEEGISNIGGRCLECHADGREHDDLLPPGAPAAGGWVVQLVNWVRRGT